MTDLETSPLIVWDGIWTAFKRSWIQTHEVTWSVWPEQGQMANEVNSENADRPQTQRPLRETADHCVPRDSLNSRSTGFIWLCCLRELTWTSNSEPKEISVHPVTEAAPV